MMEIREGDLFDLPLIVEKAKIFNDLAKDHYAKFLSYDAKGFSRSITTMVRIGAKYWVLWNNDEFAGIIMGMVTPNFYNPTEKIGACLFVAVLPEFQRSRWGSKLMEQFESWAESEGASVIQYNGYDKKFIRSMKRRGFEQAEVSLMKFTGKNDG